MSKQKIIIPSKGIYYLERGFLCIEPEVNKKIKENEYNSPFTNENSEYIFNIGSIGKSKTIKTFYNTGGFINSLQINGDLTFNFTNVNDVFYQIYTDKEAQYSYYSKSDFMKGKSLTLNAKDSKNLTVKIYDYATSNNRLNLENLTLSGNRVVCSLSEMGNLKNLKIEANNLGSLSMDHIPNIKEIDLTNVQKIDSPYSFVKEINPEVNIKLNPQTILSMYSKSDVFDISSLCAIGDFNKKVYGNRYPDKNLEKPLSEILNIKSDKPISLTYKEFQEKILQYHINTIQSKLDLAKSKLNIHEIDNKKGLTK